jgi:polysaccharide pyruvyl transferase WcaK-like protein
MRQIKRILVDNSGYELKNYGDTAMLQVAISRLEKLFPDSEIYVFTTSPEKLKKYCPSTIAIPQEVTLDGRKLWNMRWNIFGGFHKLLPTIYLKDQLAFIELRLKYKFPDIMRLWISWRLNRKGYKLTSMHQFLDLIASTDIVVASGGGYVTDSFESHAFLLLGTLTLAKNKGKPTAMFGQGIGPIKQQFLLDISRFCLPQIDLVCLREANEGLPFLRTIGVSEEAILVTGDDAIEFAYSNRPNTIGSDIGINIRVAYYSEVDQTVVAHIKPVLQNVKELYHSKLRPIPISTHEGDSDLVSIKLNFGDILDTNPDALTAPIDVIKEVGCCRVVVTGSYHAAVFALSQGVSAVCLVNSHYYQNKFQGLANQFHCGCYIVNMADTEFTKNLQLAIDEAWANAESLRDKLLKAARSQISQSNNAYEQFAQLVKDK